MPSPEHQAYRERLLFWFRSHASEAGVAEQLERHRDAAAALWELDLEPARAVLMGCYAENPRGGKPWDPIIVLRCLLLMVLVVQTSINKWAADLAGNRILRVLAGLREDEGRPGVGTFYDFFARLQDGPIRKTCEHQERPSEAERRRSRTPRAKPPKAPQPEPEPAAEGGKRGRKKRKKKAKALVTAPASADAVTEKLVAELQAGAELANPNDLLERLGTILRAVAVQGSLVRGFLGDPTKLTVGGDGSPLRTGASRYGKRTCDHPKDERCDCPRIYEDPDARVGWDSHRKTYYYGHHFYEVSASAGGHDLPLAIRLDPGNASDYTQSLLTLDRFYKSLGTLARSVRIAHFIADRGHDAEPIYRYCLGHGSIPVIPLRGEAPATHPARPDLRLSPRGVPTCQADVEMAPWGSAGEHRKVFICPVKAGTLDRCPLAPPELQDWVCRPDQKWGPSVAVNAALNPRLCPPIPRNSPQFQELMNLRSGTERSNSVKKEAFKLEAARHRRASFWLTRLHLIAVLQHARVWVAAGAAKVLVDHLLGREPASQAA
jgi:hypothetical protein